MDNFEVIDASAAARSAGVGVFLQAQIISPVFGRLRATPYWLGTALNCAALDDPTPFLWQFEKLPGGAIAVGSAGILGQRMVYASARDDSDWHVQLQVNNTAEWVTAAQRD